MSPNATEAQKILDKYEMLVGKAAEIEGEEEGTRSLTKEQEETSILLRTQLKAMAKTIKGSKMKLHEKVRSLNALIKSHEALTKTERTIAGLDRPDAVLGAGEGVIMIPVKVAADKWQATAYQEVEAAKSKQVGPRVSEDRPRGEVKDEGA